MVPRSLLPFIKMYSVFIVDCVWERYWRSSKEFLPKKWSFSELRVSQRVVWLGKIMRRAVDNQFNLPDLSPSAVAIGNSDEIPLYTSGEYFWILARRRYVILLPLWTKCHATLPFLLLIICHVKKNLLHVTCKLK